MRDATATMDPTTAEPPPAPPAMRGREARALIAWGVGLFFVTALALWLAHLARTPLLLLYVSALLALGFTRVVR